ncbi:ANTAR domain-containing protein [Streptomyces cylindrosporus]|uniref:ANTAR domain-containing protein n=1 Tax=Streptomyces cylindrosporus TaxID=2927583 RepID=A0ABS9YMZ6_9ACTN|nr:ANTAR domain-containing protein [Streptomyces cylindrosporus]MCI3278520.1 ANTAR domain-containing protein [Streptomyces cylindrosporus]
MTEQNEPTEQLAALRQEVEQLRRALVSHAVVDQAIGVLRAHGLRPGEGWELLQQVSQRSNVKLRHIAEHILRWADGEGLPDGIADALRATLVDGRRLRFAPGQERPERRRTPPEPAACHGTRVKNSDGPPGGPSAG